MLSAATSTWAPIAIGAGPALVLMVALWWSIVRPLRRHRVSWADFERQFAEYVADRAGEAPETDSRA